MDQVQQWSKTVCKDLYAGEHQTSCTLLGSIVCWRLNNNAPRIPASPSSCSQVKCLSTPNPEQLNPS